MANHRSAEKRHRQSERRRERNKHWLSTVRNAIRLARSGVAEGAADRGERIRRAESLLRRAASKGVVHPRTVSRTVSRLHKLQSSPR